MVAFLLRARLFMKRRDYLPHLSAVVRSAGLLTGTA